MGSEQRINNKINSAYHRSMKSPLQSTLKSKGDDHMHHHRKQPPYRAHTVESSHSDKPSEFAQTFSESNPIPPRPEMGSGYLQWVESFIKALFDFSFSEVITVKMLPILYSIALAALSVTLGYITIETMLVSPLRGVILLLLIDPLLFLFGTAAIRTLLEFCAVLFKVQSLMIEMNDGVKQAGIKLDLLVGQIGSMDGHLGNMLDDIHDMRTNFQSVTRIAENLDGMTGKIPFIKKPKREDRKNWAESSISERFQYTTRSFYKIDD